MVAVALCWLVLLGKWICTIGSVSWWMFLSRFFSDLRFSKFRLIIRYILWCFGLGRWGMLHGLVRRLHPLLFILQSLRLGLFLLFLLLLLLLFAYDLLLFLLLGFLFILLCISFFFLILLLCLLLFLFSFLLFFLFRELFVGFL